MYSLLFASEHALHRSIVKEVSLEILQAYTSHTRCSTFLSLNVAVRLEEASHPILQRMRAPPFDYLHRHPKELAFVESFVLRFALKLTNHSSGSMALPPKL